MDELYDDAVDKVFTAPNKDVPWHDSDNRAFVYWYNSLLMSLCERAMGEAAYGQIHDSTSGFGVDTLISNYLTSCVFDSDENWIFRKVMGALDGEDGAFTWDGVVDTGFTIPSDNYSDLQAPVLYPVWQQHACPNWTPATDPAECWSTSEDCESDVWKATMRVSRHNMDALIKSLNSQTDASEKIVPWIVNVDYTVNLDSGFDCTTFTQTKAHTREMLAMLRARDIREFILWDGGVDTAAWNDFDDLVHQVWMYDLDSTTAVNMEVG